MIEWLIVFLFITFGSAVLLAPMAKYLLAYSDRIETMTELPLP